MTNRFYVQVDRNEVSNLLCKELKRLGCKKLNTDGDSDQSDYIDGVIPEGVKIPNVITLTIKCDIEVEEDE